MLMLLEATRPLLLAEVMDKEPSVVAVLAWAMAGAVVGFVACRRFPWLTIALFPLASLLPFAVAQEVLDPYVGPAIMQEAGAGYAAACLVSLAMGIAGPLAGGVLGWRERIRDRTRVGEEQG
jgi:hypothetical protein